MENSNDENDKKHRTHNYKIFVLEIFLNESLEIALFLEIKESRLAPNFQGFHTQKLLFTVGRKKIAI